MTHGSTVTYRVIDESGAGWEGRRWSIASSSAWSVACSRDHYQLGQDTDVCGGKEDFASNDRREKADISPFVRPIPRARDRTAVSDEYAADRDFVRVEGLFRLDGRSELPWNLTRRLGDVM